MTTCSTEAFHAWSRGQFPITITDVHGAVGVVPVDGIVIADGHLGLHVRDQRIDVTHVASGKRLASCATLGAALACVHALYGTTDWSVIDPVITPAAYAALTEARG